MTDKTSSSRAIRDSRISPAALFLRSVRFSLERAAALHDVPGRDREFAGHAYSAFYLLEEADRHRYGGRYRVLAREEAGRQTARSEGRP